MTLPCLRVNVAVAIRRNTCPLLPDRPQRHAWLDVKGALGLQSRGIVGHDPTLAVIVTAVRAKSDVDVAIRQKKPGAIDLIQIGEGGNGAVQGVGCGYGSRPAESFMSAAHVECV